MKLILEDIDIYDGWNLDEDFDCTVIEDLNRAIYEIENGARGAYTDCTTYPELGKYLKKLAKELDYLGDDLISHEE